MGVAVEGWLIFLGIIGAIWFIVWLNNRMSDLQEKAEMYVELKSESDNLEAELDS